MSSDDASAPVKKPSSEAQIQALNKARAKALDLKTQRNVIREKKKKTDDIDATPEETDATPAETENSETENSETESDEQPKPAVVEKKPRPAVVESKPKTEPAPKPKPQSPKPKPQPKEAHVPIPQNDVT